MPAYNELAFEVDQEGRFEDQRVFHLSIAGASPRLSASTRSSAAASKTAPRSLQMSRNLLPVVVVSGHVARKTTALNDSPG